MFEILLVDFEVFRDLEFRVNDIVGNLDYFFIFLGNNLKVMLYVSMECFDVYSICVDYMSEIVDVNIKVMYIFIVRCEELNVSLKLV